MNTAKSILGILLAAITLASFSACGSSAKEKETSPADKTESSTVTAESSETLSGKESTVPESSEISEIIMMESNTDEKSEIEFSNDSNIKVIKNYKTLDEYITSDTAKKTIEEIIQSDNESEIPVSSEIKAEDHTKFVFERTLNEELEYPDAFLKTLTTTMDKRKDVYIKLVKELRSSIEDQKITVVVRYFDDEQNKIFEREFDEKGVVEASEQSDN